MPKDIFKLMEEEDEKTSISEAHLGILSDMAKRQQEFLEPVEEGDERLHKLYEFVMKKKLSLPLLAALVKMVSADYERLRTIDIPELMVNQLGLKALELAGGAKLTIKDGLACSVTKKNEPAFFGYLKEIKNDDIIKHEITILFSSDENKKAEKVIKDLEKQELDYKEKRGVHGSTLKKFVKDRLKVGKKISELVYVHEYDYSEIK